MDFALSDDQRLLQDSVEKLLSKNCSLDVVRAYADTQNHSSLWKNLADLGALGVLIPERYNGAGLGLLEAALIAQALGAHAAPVPYASTAVVAPLALSQAGSAKQQETYLPAMAAGDICIGHGLYSSHSQLKAQSAGSAHTLSGRVLFCLDGTGAQHYLLSAKDALYLVPADAKGLTITPMPAIDITNPVQELTLDNTPAQMLGNGKSADTIAQCLLTARLLLAADSLGAMQAMLTKARDYALERKQFNRVIGSFQAVKHLCAEMAAQIEPCHALLWYSAHAFDKQLDDAALNGLYAKAHISEVGKFVARTATEIHGGMGFTDLLGLHYWFKRLGHARQILGSPQELRTLAGALQNWG